MKKIIFALTLTTLLSACSDNEVGDVSLGMFTMKDVVNNTRQFFFN